MKKQIIFRGLIGFPIGIAIGYIITIVISLIWGNGYYSPCVPSLAQSLGSELSAVALQAMLCGILGSGFAVSSIIWEIDYWSIAKQTFIYFIIISFLMLPTAYLTHWMEHSLSGFLIYFGIFAIIFTLIWLIQYLIMKSSISRINRKING